MRLHTVNISSMYRHILDTQSEQIPFLRHFRESETNSGLIVIHEIARTVMEAVVAKPSSEELLVASGFVTAPRAPSTNLIDITKSIIANSLDELVPTGLQAWGQLCGPDDVQTARAYLYEAELHEPVDADNGDLIIIQDNPKTEFSAFAGTPAELEQLKKLTDTINSRTETPDGSNSLYI